METLYVARVDPNERDTNPSGCIPHVFGWFLIGPIYLSTREGGQSIVFVYVILRHVVATLFLVIHSLLSCLRRPEWNNGTKVTRWGYRLLSTSVKKRQGFTFSVCLVRFPAVWWFYAWEYQSGCSYDGCKSQPLSSKLLLL